MSDEFYFDGFSVPCFVCGAPIKNYGTDNNHPSSACEFTSYGHYGTAVFDPMDGSFIAINICDPCLLTGKKSGRVLRGVPAARSPQPRAKYYLWEAA